MLTQADHQRINAAVTAAEQKTAGEIFCVLAQEVSRYREVPLLWATLAAFVVPPLLALAGLHHFAPGDLFATWSSGGRAESLIREAVSGYALLQAALFFIVAIIVAIPSVRRVMTPRALKRHRVRQVARHHFTASGARVTDAQPHILIFASLHDRQVELVAHKAIHQAVGNGPWNASVAAVIAGMKANKPADGFVKAIEICGDALAKHFPSDGTPRNLLSNDITVL